MQVITNNAKNLLLVFLVGFSIYQTAELWLRDSLSRNFFYVLLAQYNTGANANINNFVLPYRIVTSIGNNRFDIMYTGVSESNKRQLVDYAITVALNDGEYIATHETIDFNRVLSYRSIIYEYRFSMPTETFVRVLAEGTDMLASEFSYFNSVAVIPSPNASNLVYFIFMDTENNRAYEYQVIRSSLHDMLNREIQNSHRNLSAYQIYYVSSELMGLDFRTNIFLPRWRGQEYEYNMVRILNNHYEIQPTVSAVGRNLYMFFENPAAVWSNIRDNIFIYSDENIVVQYFQNGVLEYINYRHGTTQGDLLSDFDVATRFLSSDTMVINETFLAGFTEAENKRVFYFDYVINNFPIIFTDRFKQDMGLTDLSHAIEITVQNGIVTRYRKIAYSFEVAQEMQIINADLITVVDDIVGRNVSDISFGYNIFKIDRNSDSNFMTLEWIVNHPR